MDSIKELEERLESSNGEDQLRILSKLSQEYLNISMDDSLRYALSAYDMIE